MAGEWDSPIGGSRRNERATSSTTTGTDPLGLFENRRLAIGLVALLVFELFTVWRFVRPMNIFVVDERFERPMVVEIPDGSSSLSAEERGGCHEEIYEERSGSIHAQAWTDPYYQVDYRFDGSQQIRLN